METYAGILTIIVVVALIWWGVKKRNAWHAAHSKDESGSGSGGKDRQSDKK